jgi:uncharacterized membrane protein
MGPPTDIFATFLWNVGYSLCHQLPERSFIIGGMQMPVCARDTGIYLGFLAVLGIFYLGKRYRRRTAPDRLVMAFAAVGVGLYAFDALSSYLGFRSTSNDVRLLVGLAFGSGVAMLLLSAASISLFRGNEPKRVFSFKDIAIIIPILALASTPLVVDMGAVAYYLEATLVIAGYLIMLFFVMALFISVIRSWNLTDPRTACKLLAISAVFEAFFLVALWTVKYFVWPGIPLPG